ncbi:MAG: Crp/Fnr family transcriptional regulator [Steroidobacteraceae bacterium]|nr:Crp/Fnr family transcriptional regulator [Steroidobacteraceae bacterium]
MTASRHPSFPIALLPCASRLDLQPSRSVFRTGTPPRHIHFVEEGAVRLVRHGRQGEEVVLHDARPGEFLAEASLDSARYHCDAVTSLPTVILRVAKDDFRRLLVDDADFARIWMALLAAQLRTARARIERLSLRSAEERVRHLLLSEGRGSPCELKITGSLKDLARRLGLTHESLYRTLARMQKAGVIDREGMLLRLAKDGGPERMT